MNDWILEMLLSMLRTFLLKSSKAAQYARYLLKARDYLLLLFPTEQYPEFALDDPYLNQITVTPVPVAEVKKAGSKFGFNIPFVHGA